jgi:hypothetical protein
LEDIRMMRKRFFALATAVAMTACTDNPNEVLTGPIDPSQPFLPTPAIATLFGKVSVRGDGVDRLIELTATDGRIYRLVGSESGSLASVDGGDVLAWGTFDANPGFVVQDFQVTGMHGRPALDGVLEATAEGFALRLRDGTLRAVRSLSPDCAEHIGPRLWVVGWNETEVQFGLISVT